MELKLPSPSADAVRAAREAAGHTQRQAEEACGLRPGRFHKFESGLEVMPAIRWEIYLLATDQHPQYRIVRRQARAG